jgi:antirestriction protein ArdC
VAYLAAWLRVLKSDHHAIIRAGSMASKAADLLLVRPCQVDDKAEFALAA